MEADMYKGKDRRRHRRQQLVVKVTHIMGGAFAYYFSQDISIGGMFLSTKDQYTLGETLELEFRLPDEQDKVHVFARVARLVKEEFGRRDITPGMGVEFVEFSEDSEKRLIRFLKDNKR